MEVVVTSAPAKIILFGEHGVNRQQPALATAIDLRTYCCVSPRRDDYYTLRIDERHEESNKRQLRAFKSEIDELRGAQAIDAIREQARDFFAPSRYVLAHVLEQLGLFDDGTTGVDIVWRSALPIGAGLGSGAAANTSMVLALHTMADVAPTRAEIVQMAWLGDVIAHGGVASSLDSSTSAYGGVVRYTATTGAEILPLQAQLPIVIGDTLVQHNTAALNTIVRRWLEERPVRIRLFENMGWTVERAIDALGTGDMITLGHLMNIHQLFQEKMGTSIPKCETLIEAALEAGALGAKISGSGGGGIIIALTAENQQAPIATAIDKADGRSYTVTSGTEGVRLEDIDAWELVPAK